MNRLIVVFILLSSPASPALAAEDCRTLGWHFYCDPSNDISTPKAKPEPAPQPDAQARIKAIRDRLDDLKATAILDPSPQNLIAYIRYQRRQLDRASVFSDQWRRVIWQNPEIDYDLIRPTGSLAKRAWSDTRKQSTTATLSGLNNRYGLFYFHRGTDCRQCRTFETALKPFSETHNLDILAVTLDGVPSPSFPTSLADNGQASRLGITGDHLPALVLFDTHQSQVIPVGYGALAADELERRIYILTQVEVGDDY